MQTLAGTRNEYEFVMIDQLLEFVSHHPLLVGAFVVVGVAFMAYEARRNAAGGVSSGEATALINREDGVIVDLRDKSEFRKAHIPGSRNIPNDRLDDRMQELDEHKDKPIIVVCKMGQQSGAAVEKLKKAGFTRAVRLKGGISQWQADNLPTARR